jgi:6-phosphogluconolactonase
MRNVPLFSLTLFAALALMVCAPAGADDWRVYIGTYTGGDSEGIYTFTLDGESGEPGEASLAVSTENPSFLALHPEKALLYACGQAGQEGAVSAFRIEGATGKLTLLNTVSSEGKGPCHVDVSPSGRHVAVANYSGGSMALLPINETGSLEMASATQRYEGQGPHPTRQQAAYAHAADFGPEGRALYVTDLGTDRVHVYGYDAEAGTLVPAEPPAAILAPGAGPRHLDIHPNGRFAYVVNELDNTVTAFARDDTGNLETIQTVRTLPDDFAAENTTAEIVVHPSGAFVYASNRGHDSIAGFAIDAETGRLTAIGHTPTGGKTPRNFSITPDGRFLLAANQDTNTVVIFRIDTATGALSATGGVVDVSKPVCIVFTR